MPRVRTACRYRGGAATVDIHVDVAQAGPVQIELIADFTSGPSIFRDLRDRHDHKGTGFHQICTVTKDYDAKKAHYTNLGYELACEFTSPGVHVLRKLLGQICNCFTLGVPK
jgi:Glyoxalase/Bleomycin resistance protein/Dioxygenase superfamily